MSSKVIVLGGGVAGLSAAHELAERGFAVEVFERNSIPGGKARSVEVPDTGRDGRPGYPGEHGFRFFPGFYKHVTDTMKRIPYGDNKHGVYDNLIATSRIEMALFDRAPFVMCASFPRSMEDFILIIQDAYSDVLGVTKADCEFFGARIWQILTSCQQRRDSEYEKIGWWEFIDAENRSKAYQNIFGYGLTRSLVAAKANLASTKTVGDILVQLIFNDLDPSVATDRVLNGPTNDVWICPWLKHLESMGVKYHLNAEVTEITCVNKVITGATVEKDGERFEVKGDYYISAMPVEKMAQVITESPALLEADPTISTVVELSENVAWMNGAQFYLKSDAPICHGHVIYADSPWALTSISQHQFWSNTDLSKYGDGQVRGILSVDISEWTEPGIVVKKPAQECTRDEVKTEVWAQLKRSLNTMGQVVLSDDNLLDWNLDSDIVFEPEIADGTLVSNESDSLSAQTQSVKTKNREPLLVNLINTWHLRPNAHIGISNLFLASDYVQTYTDLATMEGANEAARRATNAIIDASGVHATPCRLWKLHEPDILAPLRGYDLVRFEMGLPWKKPLSEIELKDFGHLAHKH
jgi:uncharacterized protein with NAD-binding domain and iron-sulfur cluster